MGVLPVYRRQGIGRKLLSAVLEKAREIGIERVELVVFSSNKVAIALYEEFGFHKEGVKQKSWKLDGKYEDDIVMGLIFQTNKE
jgi:ribosomal protein S18 acetylase RimI-like enzyme